MENEGRIDRGRRLAAVLPLVAVLAGCGAAADVTNLVTSTPNASALQVAEANVSEASTALAAYFAEHGTYAGASASSLPGLASTVSVTSTASAYCVESVVDGVAASLHGPGAGAPQPGTCA